MIDLDRVAARLKEDLSKVIDAPEVRAVRNDRYKAFVFVTSPSFEDLDEFYRQRHVWTSVFRVLDQDEQDYIEFIFTDAPSEVEVEN